MCQESVFEKRATKSLLISQKISFPIYTNFQNSRSSWETCTADDLKWDHLHGSKTTTWKFITRDTVTLQCSPSICCMKS